MRQKSWLPLLLVLALLLPLPAAGEMIPGYSAKAGPVFALFGRYPQAADGAVSPIRWLVLRVEGTRALLLSEKVLDARPANAEGRYEGFETSTLAAWLNGEFAAAAFADWERAALLPQEGEHPLSLVSTEQLKDPGLGFKTPRDRVAAGTPYALAGRLAEPREGEAAYWILERSDSNRNSQRRVMKGGAIGHTPAHYKTIGVRPLVLVDLSLVPGFLGSGSPEDPYLLGQGGTPFPTPAPTPVPTPAPTPKPPGETSTEGFPPLNAEGFLDPGQAEYVFIDEQNGVWRYAGQDLRIVITRHRGEGVRLRYLAAEIFVRPGAEGFRMYPFDRDNMLRDQNRYLENQSKIARMHNLVFSMGGDYFINRLGEEMRKKQNRGIGVIIRDGEILVDQPGVPDRKFLPPLDMMALFPDGGMAVYKAREKTAQELLALGARDVLSFGPWLLRDGETNLSYTTYGTTLQPRSVIGMVTKGHYWAVAVEGRIGPSNGLTLMQTTELMRELGCTTAYNLDGGWTTAMVFMGRQLNQLDKSGVRDNARTQNEVLGIGYTEAYQKGTAP